jgi:hypothetical protein
MSVEKGQLSNGVWRAYHVHRRDVAGQGRDLNGKEPARKEVQAVGHVTFSEQRFTAAISTPNACVDHTTAVVLAEATQ